MNNSTVIVASLIISAGLIIAGRQVDIDTIVKINKECVHWQTLSTSQN